MPKKGLIDILRDVFKPAAHGPAPGSDKKMDRRRFFRAGLAEVLKPLDAAIRPLEHMAREVGKLDTIEPYVPPRRNVVDRPWVRPPGAVVEPEFRLLCTKCGECISACPVYAIRIDHGGEDGAGYPYIEVDAQPCVLCDGQPCMPACPTGAMRVTPLELIDMGTANWFEPTCRRTEGEDCTLCIDDCPIGATAIELTDGTIAVHEEGCTGCGVCQSRCPTDPKSIIVIPKSSRGTR